MPIPLFFRAENESIICREILKNPPSDPNPSPRTAEYYAKRPCSQIVEETAKIWANYLKKQHL